MNLFRFARVAVVAGRAETAARLLASFETLCEELGLGARPWLAEMTEQTLARIHEQVGDDVFADRWEEGRKLTADEAVALALDSLD